MSKVKLKEGEEHCTRCFGNQLFFVRVHNGVGVPAQPAHGICYRCGGSGIEASTNNIKYGRVFTMFKKEDVKEVILIVFVGICNSLTSRNKKMANITQIMVALEGNKYNLTEGEVKKVIGKLIEVKYIRYSELKTISYYGVSALGDDRYKAYLNTNFGEVEQLVQREIASTTSNLIRKEVTNV